jgi:8-oxo-dGTP pyrophosphatase MutT (NUDIX family)
MKEHTTPLDETFKELSAKLPRSADGRIDYSHADRALVLTCFVRFEGKILLLKRSEQVRTYRGKWHAVAGYIDEPKPVREKALEELKEELGVRAEQVSDLRLGAPFEFTDLASRKSWIVYPVLAELKEKPQVRLDWEHVEFRWVLPEEIRNYATVPRLDESLRRVLG